MHILDKINIHSGEAIFICAVIIVLLWFVRGFLITYRNFMEDSIKAQLVTWIWVFMHPVAWFVDWILLIIIVDDPHKSSLLICAIMIVLFVLPMDVKSQLYFENFMVDSIRNFCKKH